jgi:hypothetical protein
VHSLNIAVESLHTRRCVLGVRQKRLGIPNHIVLSTEPRARETCQQNIELLDDTVPAVPVAITRTARQKADVSEDATVLILDDGLQKGPFVGLQFAYEDMLHGDFDVEHLFQSTLQAIEHVQLCTSPRTRRRNPEHLGVACGIPKSNR